MSGTRGVPYFYNSVTKTSVWESPEDLTAEEIAKLPGAEHLTRPAKVRASHLLVKHSGSRNPSSWREVWCYFRFPALSLTTIFAPDQHNPFQGGSYRDPPRLQSSDRLIRGEICRVRKRVLGLQLCSQRRGSWSIWRRTDAEAVRRCHLRLENRRHERYSRDRQRRSYHSSN